MIALVNEIEIFSKRLFPTIAIRLSSQDGFQAMMSFSFQRFGVA